MAPLLIYSFLGLWVGVFLNALIDLLPHANDGTGFSRCPACRARLRGWDWVPIVAYVARRGRCASCGAQWSIRGPLVELSTGLIFAWLWLSLGPGGKLLLYTVYLAVLEVILVIDVEHRLILNRLIWPAIAFALLSIPLRAWMAASEASGHSAAEPLIWGPSGILSPWAAGMLSLLLGGVLGLVVFATMWLIAPQGMGAGDVKLALFAGLITGFPGVLWAIVGSFLLAGLAAALLLLFRRVGLKSEIPFAPYMVLAAIVVLLYGEQLLRWYVGG